MKHKLFTILIAVMASFGSLFAQSGTCGDNLTWNLTDGVLTISGTGAMADYSYDYSQQIPQTPWNSYLSVIKSIVIADGITSIGNWAFANCSELTSIEIPNTVISIRKRAFSSCQNLISLSIPNSVMSIGEEVFITCSSLTSIEVAADNNNFTSINGVLFNNNLTTLIYYPAGKQGDYVIPNTVINIEKNAFSNSTGLVSVEIPNSVTSIGNYAFFYCTNLRFIEIPNSVVSIGEYAFYNCNRLKSIVLSSSVSMIGDRAFSGFSNWGSVINYATEPQMITTYVFGAAALSTDTLYVPAESVEAYQAADVWKDFGNILPIEDSEEVNYATLADIYNMAADSTFTLGAFDVMYVPDFQSGSNMYIKDSTGSCVIYKVNYGLQAGDHVEAGLQGKVSIYNGLHEVIPITAKEDLIITHGEAPAPIVATEAPSLINASQYVVYEGVSFTTDTAFVKGRRHTVYGSWNGQTITFYNQYYIGATLSANKTYNITAVNTIYRTTPQAYPLAVEEVSPAPCIIASGTCGAEGDNLTWTLTCDSVLTISGTGAMEDYEYVDGGFSSAPWNDYRETISSLEFQLGVTSIGEYAFYQCRHLTTVTLPSSVISIGRNAFDGCANLISATIPNSVTSIGWSAFSDCTGLTSVTNYATTPQSIDSYVFYDVNKSTCTLYVPAGSVDAYKAADVWKEFGIILPIEDDPAPCIFASGTCGAQGDNLTWTLTCDSVLTISGTGAMADFAYTTAPWFEYRYMITSAIIGMGVTSIGKHSLQECINMTSVQISNSVTSIGNHAFWGCYGLTTISIPKGVIYIGTSAFMACPYLLSFVVATDNPVFSSVDGVIFNKNKTVLLRCPEGKPVSYSIPAGTVTIGKEAFYGCAELTSITFPESIKSIKNFAFGYCSGLTNFVLPNSLDSIGTQAFQSCRNIATIIIPNNVTYIGSSSFAYCNNLTTIEIPASVSDIGSGAFEGCNKLVSINVVTDNQNYSSENGVLFSKDKKKLIQYPAGKSETSYSIPSTVVSINEEAFSGCKKLNNIEISNSVTNIGRAAFSYCSTLISIEIPNTVRGIGELAFYECYNLTSVVIGSHVANIGRSAFEDCGNLDSLTCKAVAPPSLGTTVFDGVNKSIPLYVPVGSGDAYVAADQWKDFTNIQEILEIPDTPTPCVIASGTCGAQGDNLTWMLSCDSVLTISGTGAMGDFADTYYVPWYNERFLIKTIIVEQGVTSIGKWSFGNCVNVSSVTLPSSISNIENWAFGGCQMESLIIPDSVLSIGNFAFYTCHTLKNLTLSSNLISIGQNAFCACENLESIEIPDKVASIGDYAFRGCSGLNSITNYASNPQSIISNVFEDVNISSCALYVPAESVSAYQAADVWKEFGNILPIEDEPAPCILVSGTCGAQGDNLTWTLTCDSVLTISGTGAMADYNINNPAPWYSYVLSVKTVVVNEGVTGIGQCAFMDCSSLTSITIPNSVISIGDGAFYGCSGLTSIEIPDSVTSIGEYAFCACYSLASIEIPNSVTSIGFGAFATCYSLASIVIPNSVTSIGEYAFGACYSLASIVIPNSVTYIAPGAFARCTSLNSINVANDNTNYISIEGVLFAIKTMTILKQYPAGKQGAYTIPNNVTSIGSRAFEGSSGLTSVIIPNGVTNIGTRAFYGCSSLTSVTNYATTPQQIKSDVFGDTSELGFVDKSACTLYVPAQSLELYQSADVWKDFGNILPIEGELPIEPTEGEFNVMYITQDGDSISSEAVMLHLPVAPEIEGFTFLKWQVVAGDLENGIIIQAVYQANEYTSAPEVYTNPANPAQKLIRNGNVYILTDDKIYSITGQEVK